MPQSPERQTARVRARRVVAILLLALGLAASATPCFAQAAGHVRAKIVKAGLLVGGGAGSGVLTYRGKSYPSPTLPRRNIEKSTRYEVGTARGALRFLQP